LDNLRLKENVSMRPACIRAIVAAVVLLSPPLAFAQSANVSGNWKMDFQSDQGATAASMVLKQDGSKLTGELTSDQGTLPLTGEIADGKLKMVMSIDACGQSLIITMNAVLEKDTLKGDADFGGFGSATWTATRAK
jgi:hypothetical protein